MKWLIAIPFIIVFLFIGTIIYVIVRVIKKSTTPKTKEFISEEQEKMQSHVTAMKKSLTPWSSYSFKDVTSAMQYKQKGNISKFLTGTIFAPDQKPIIAFQRVERGLSANGYLFASSTDFDLFYDIRINEFTVKYNGDILGEIKKNGNIYSANGTEIGNAKHPIKASFNIAAVSWRSGDNKFPLQMNGRHLATIWVAPNYSEQPTSNLSVIFNQNNWGQPILEMHDTPTPEEEKWLIALSVLEISFHGHWLI